ncbi:MAG: aspartate/glutamate racemase family protein [Chitinophagaceae bacterium]|jgi:glutamate racemase|nr:aspartate/glutamate racemase family protein [Chitinophagaceae bacterium]
MSKVTDPKFWILLVFLSTGTKFTQAQIQKPKAVSPIGVFDSGTGGLTVLEALLTIDEFNNLNGATGKDGIPDFQQEHFQYLADQANMPYGNYAAENKTPLLKEHILKNMRFLLGNSFLRQKKVKWELKPKESAKMLVLACNTATAFALADIRQFLKEENSEITVIGVIDAGVKAALQHQREKGRGAIGVFATAGTVASNGYPRTLIEMSAKLSMPEPIIVSQGGAGLAESIDRDWSYYVDTASRYRKEYKGPSIKNAQYKIDTTLISIYRFNRTGNKLLCEYDDKGACQDIQLNDPENYVRYHLVSMLEKMRQNKMQLPMNTLILGCTHYPFMRPIIQQVLSELFDYQDEQGYRYRDYLAKEVALIDPSYETAKEAYQVLREKQLQHTGSKQQQDLFFITIPNKELAEIELQEDGWFTYGYKYGRKAGENKQYVKYVPFDKVNISAATYLRIEQALPAVYKDISKVVIHAGK